MIGPSWHNYNLDIDQQRDEFVPKKYYGLRKTVHNPESYCNLESDCCHQKHLVAAVLSRRHVSLCCWCMLWNIGLHSYCLDGLDR